MLEAELFGYERGLHGCAALQGRVLPGRAPVDVWILAATSSDLEAAMRGGLFHDALYHRLSVLKLWLPPLRERGADITLLAEHFAGRACRDHGLPAKRLHEGARAVLGAHAWPGNVRELGGQAT